MKQYKGFKYCHLTNEPEDQELTTPISSTNCHLLVCGSSGSGKTTSLKHHLDQTKSDYLVFGRDSNKIRRQNFIPLELEKFDIEKLANKTKILEDAGAYKQLRTQVEDLFRFGRHQNIQSIFLAHYAKYVLPNVRENCVKLYSTINSPDNFFD